MSLLTHPGAKSIHWMQWSQQHSKNNYKTY